MSPSLQPASPPSTAEAARAREDERRLRDELVRIRAAALAWRNGLAGLLTALLGFSLIKGRSDVTSLEPWAATVVGLLLGMAAVAGAFAATKLLRSAHGRPVVRERSSDESLKLSDHQETIASAEALVQGTIFTFVVAALLIIAVALTWFGPSRSKPVVLVVNLDNSGFVCSEKVMALGGALVAEKGVPGKVELANVGSIRGAAECPKR